MIEAYFSFGLVGEGVIDVADSTRACVWLGDMLFPVRREEFETVKCDAGGYCIVYKPVDGGALSTHYEQFARNCKAAQTRLEFTLSRRFANMYDAHDFATECFVTDTPPTMRILFK